MSGGVGMAERSVKRASTIRRFMVFRGAGFLGMAETGLVFVTFDEILSAGFSLLVFFTSELFAFFCFTPSVGATQTSGKKSPRSFLVTCHQDSIAVKSA